MSRPSPEQLRDSLRELADGVEATDLYVRAVRRSGRIARREAAIGAGAALLVLGVLAAGLWRLPGGVEPPAEPRSRVLADLPGQVFYQETGDQPDVLRLSPADGHTDRVPTDVPSPVEISPDGTRKLVAETAVLDTVTGELVTLPVSGEVLGAAFDSRGYLLVRTLRAGVIRLSLVAPDNTLVVQADEPAAVRYLDLLAYTG